MAGDEPDPLRVLYIAGSSRTGSTILDRVLGQLDGFFSAGELGYLFGRGLVARRPCGCGAEVADCPVWSAVLAAAFEQPPDAEKLALSARHWVKAGRVADLRTGRLGSDDLAYREALARTYRALAAVTGARVIVDSSKSPIYALLLDSIPGLRLSVVHIVRDARAVAHSCQRTKAQPDFSDGRSMMREAPATSARRWMKWQGLTELLWRRADGYLLVRYEDLVRDPPAAVRAMAALAGESPRVLPFVGPHSVRLGVTHSVSGNPNRFQTGVVDIQDDDEWRTALTARDRAVVTAMTWPLLLRHRYPLSV